MLLPEAIHHGCRCDAFVAIEAEAPQRIIGAIAIAPLMQLTPCRGPKIAVHVIEPWRRRGVARGLLDLAAELSAARGAEALYAWSRVDPESAEARAWRAMGFAESLECSLTRVDGASVIALLEPLVDRVRARGWIPADARIVSLRDVDPDRVVELVTAHLGGSGAETNLRERLVGRHPRPLDPFFSRVLVQQGEVVGAMLGSRVNAQTGWVEINVLHPSVRGGWANVWLKLEATRAAYDTGYHTFLYETHPQHVDTRGITRRLKGAVMPRVDLYRLIATSRR
jgi:hypothetical protein